MEIKIIRHSYRSWGVDGRLFINGRRVCDTVEHPIYHIPEGEYLVSKISSRNPLADSLNGVIPSPFTHGDGALRSTKGEIIVGRYVLPGLVTDSVPTQQRLYERMRKSWQRGKRIKLVVW